MSPEDRIAELEATVAAQAVVIAELRAELEGLKDRLARDSGNSSLPPSRDGKDRRQRRAEEREARKAARRDGAGESGRRPGKQPGAPGVTMRRREPEFTVTHTPVSCDHCDRDLAGAVVVGTATRQVVDIPDPALVVTDHVVEKRRCECGLITTAAFPAEATGPTCWGPGVKAAAVYLMIRQHVPLERAHEAMEALFGAPVSEGALANWTLDTAQRLAPFITEVKALLRSAPVVCADETPVRCGTGSSFVHTISTDTLTLLAHHASRGIDAITSVGVLDHYQGVIMHDGLNVYAATDLAGAGHAQCHAHLDRHLIEVGAWHKHTAWCEQMRRVLTDAQRATRQALAAGLDRVPAEIARPIRRRYDETLTLAFDTLPTGPPPRRRNRGGWLPKDRDAWNLATRFRVEADQILRLLDNTIVPATNNDAERSLRMCKIHDKISGLFRSQTHAAAFCTIRSYIQTGLKHDQPTLPLLQRLYTGPPWLPTG